MHAYTGLSTDIVWNRGKVTCDNQARECILNPGLHYVIALASLELQHHRYKMIGLNNWFLYSLMFCQAWQQDEEEIWYKGNVMEGGMGINLQIKEMYLDIFITVVSQDLVIETKIPMIHCRLTYITVIFLECSSHGVPGSWQFSSV